MDKQRCTVMNKQEAIRKVAQVAMADLIGCSEPPEGVDDNYPFNAVAWRKSLPEEWQAEAEQALIYVYHYERMHSGARLYAPHTFTQVSGVHKRKEHMNTLNDVEIIEIHDTP